MRIIYRQLVVEDEGLKVETFRRDISATQLTSNGLFDNGFYYSLPAWLEVYYDVFGYVDFFVVNTNTPSVGTYAFSFSSNNGNEYMVIINKVLSTAIPQFTTDGCCDGGTNIWWLNREGGYENYTFTGKKVTFELSEGDSSSYKTQALESKYSELNNIYKAIILNTGDIPKSHLEKLASLRDSIQSWIYSETLPLYYDTKDRFTEIKVDRQSFVLNDTKERIVQRTIRVLVAKEKVIQTQ